MRKREFLCVAFPEPLRLKYPPGKAAAFEVYNWILEADFPVRWLDPVDGEWHEYVATKGLTTDMSSIPWWAQSLPGLQKAGKSVKASVIHDHIFENRPAGWSRADADWLLYCGLRANGRGWLPARMMYWAARLAGGKLWRT